MSFKPEKYFMDAVNSGDIQEIKIAMCLYIDKDPGDYNGDIKNAINYLDSKGIDIWQEHKEIEPLKSKEQWDRDYIGLLQSDLMHNFSKERLDNILKVGKYIYGRSQIIDNNHKNFTSTNKGVSNEDRINKNGKNKNIKRDCKSSQYVKTSNNNQVFNNDDIFYYQKRDEMIDKYNKKVETLNQEKTCNQIVAQGSNDKPLGKFIKCCRKKIREVSFKKK